MRLIDLATLKKAVSQSPLIDFTDDDIFVLLDNAPSCTCKTCKYYHPYHKMFSTETRGDGYCVIARMTPEGMTTINCNDNFYCSDYQKGGETVAENDLHNPGP